MLHPVTQLDETIIRQLISVYSESMSELKPHFGDDAEMRGAYAAFLRDFVKDPKQRILAEADGEEWVSALRAIESAEGHWFLEAVETKPEQRQKGFGRALLCHTVDYLKRMGMRELTCTIAKNNAASRALHEKCGFVPTEEPPVNCWGEWEEGTILYRWRKEIPACPAG